MVTDRGTGSYTMVVRAGKGFGRFPCPLGSVEPLNAVRGRIEGNFGRAGNVKVVLNAMERLGYFCQTVLSVRARIRHWTTWALTVAGASFLGK